MPDVNPEQRRAAAAVARELVAQSIAMLQRALMQVQLAAPTGHDATVAVQDARRAAEIAGAKLDLLIKRIPS